MPLGSRPALQNSSGSTCQDNSREIDAQRELELINDLLDSNIIHLFCYATK